VPLQRCRNRAGPLFFFLGARTSPHLELGSSATYLSQVRSVKVLTGIFPAVFRTLFLGIDETTAVDLEHSPTPPAHFPLQCSNSVAGPAPLQGNFLGLLSPRVAQSEGGFLSQRVTSRPPPSPCHQVLETFAPCLSPARVRPRWKNLSE